MNKWYEKSGKDADVVISTRIRLARNLRDFPFYSRMSDAQRRAVIDKVGEAIVKARFPGEKELTVYKSDDLTNIQLLSFLQKHIISNDFAGDDHPRALILSKDETISIMVGEEDHLRIQVMGEGLQPAACYEMADKIDDLLCETIEYAYDKDLGYLTHCPTNLGTGLRASVMLHLPALEHTGMIRQVVNTVSKLGLAIRGSYGEGTEAVGSIYQLSNQVTLGISEKDAIANLETITNQIIATEREARRTILQQTDFDDKIYRTLGTLKYARKMSSRELIDLLSLLRMGVSVGLVKGITYEQINKLTSDTGSAEISQMTASKDDPEERDRIRADIVRTALTTKEE